MGLVAIRVSSCCQTLKAEGFRTIGLRSVPLAALGLRILYWRPV
jgi:hypothetical protein